jgi:hypothetical protein
MGTWINIGVLLREISCSHPSTATHTEAFREPEPHVTSRTVCLVCGKSITPRQRIPDDAINSMLMGAAEIAKRED